MNLVERAKIFLFKRTPEELTQDRRERQWNYHVKHEIPNKSEQIGYCSWKPEFIDSFNPAY